MRCELKEGERELSKKALNASRRGGDPHLLNSEEEGRRGARASGERGNGSIMLPQSCLQR